MFSKSIIRDPSEPLLSMERSAKPLCYLLLLIYTINTVFIPYDTFHLKVVSLIILLIIGVRCWFVLECEKPILLYGLFVTTFTIFMSIVLTGDIAGNIRGGYMGFILLLYPIIKYYRIDFEKLLMRTIIVMAWFLLIIALLDFFKIYTIDSSKIASWYLDTENGSFSKRGEEIYDYYLFLKTSPMLVIAMPYCFKKKAYINFLIVFAAMFFSGTRANQLVSVLAVFACVILIKDMAVSRTIRLFLMVFVVVAIVIDGRIIEYFVDYFRSKSYDDSIRRATKDTILNGWLDYPFNLIIGTGYTSTIFDPTRKEMMPIVEVSYWNLLRQVGLVPFLAFMIMYIYPVVKLIKENRQWVYAVAFVGYLAICYNDPLLYSTTGMTVLLYMYCLCFKQGIGRESLGEIN